MPSVLITGAAKRIGHHMAKYFATKNYNIMLHYHQSQIEVNALAESLQKEFPTLTIATIKADLLNVDEATTLINQCLLHVDTLDVLINNASVFAYDQLCSFEPSALAHMMEVHLTAPLLLAKSFSKLSRPVKKGHIINMTDARIERLTPHYLSYSLSKSALWTATQILAMELAPDILVNAIAPGPTLPSSQDLNSFYSLCERLPLKSPAHLQDFNYALDFLLNSTSTTGQILYLDSGQHLGSTHIK